MASAFTVSGPAGPVTLDLERRGRFTVTVKNLIARPLRARLQFARAGTANKAWVSISGEPVAQLGVNESHDFQVEIAVPPDAAAGAYTVVPEAVSVSNPDDENATGGPVTFTVKAPPGTPPPSAGYLTTLIGAMSAAIVAALVGTLPGVFWLISITHLPPGANQDFWQGIGQAFGQAFLAGILIALGLLAGLWVGPPVGALIALRIRSYTGAGWTALALAILQPIWVVALVLVMSTFFKNLKGVTSVVVPIVFYVVATALPPWPARGLVVWLQRRDTKQVGLAEP